MKSRIKNLLKNIPIVNHRVRAYEISKKFKTEIDLLKNRSKNDSTAPSIIHFSVNKAATQHVKGVLQKIAIKNDLKPVSIHDYAFETQLTSPHKTVPF